MGEYADLEIDRMITGHESWGDRPRRYYTKPSRPTCNSCGKGHLYWDKTPSGWILSEYNPRLKHYVPHTCSMTLARRFNENRVQIRKHSNN